MGLDTPILCLAEVLLGTYGSPVNIIPGRLRLQAERLLDGGLTPSQIDDVTQEIENDRVGEQMRRVCFI